MRIFWAFALILFGVTYLGAGFGWWSYSLVSSLWQFWPLILVFWGLDLLTKKTNFYIPVMIVALVLSGAFIYSALYGRENNIGFWNQNLDDQTRTSEFTRDIPKGAKSAEITVNTGAVDFKVGGETDALLSGKLVSSFATPEIVSELEGDKVVASISTETDEPHRGMMFWGRQFVNDLTLALTRDLPIKLIVKSGASKIDLDLTDYQLSGLTVQTGASTVTARIGEKVVNGAMLLFETGATTIDLDFPDSVGVKITTETGLSTKEFEGYTERDGAYYSPEYDKKQIKVDLRIKSGASTVRVK